MRFARLRTCRTLWDAQAPIREHLLLTCASGSLNRVPLLGKHLLSPFNARFRTNGSLSLIASLSQAGRLSLFLDNC